MYIVTSQIRRIQSQGTGPSAHAAAPPKRVHAAADRASTTRASTQSVPEPEQYIHGYILMFTIQSVSQYVHDSVRGRHVSSMGGTFRRRQRTHHSASAHRLGKAGRGG